jgi:hypothetical protein
MVLRYLKTGGRIMTCANPECGTTTIFSRGLCRACYHRQWRSGSFERQRARRNPGAQCSRDGCERTAHAKGLCTKHYQQQLHPLNLIWRNLRSRYPGQYPPKWDGSCEIFVADVGERPEENYQLTRHDPQLPWSKENVFWREPARPTTAGAAAYQRAWSYLRKFGLREADITRMRAEQDEKCPVCDGALEATHPDTGKEIRICVDHDHITNAVRALLHDHCNKLLGHANDDPAVLRRAAGYLEFHAAKGATQ